MSPVKSAASSPPAPGRSSMMTSRPSFGSRSTSARRSSSSTAASASSLAASSASRYERISASASLSSIPRASAMPWLAVRQRCAKRRLLAQLLVPPPELRHALQVGRDGRVGELALDLRQRLLDLRDQFLHRAQA